MDKSAQIKCNKRGNQQEVNDDSYETSLQPNGTKRMIRVKRERLDEDIKEYAETAMNELLGWYGYTNNTSSNNNTSSTSNEGKKDAIKAQSLQDEEGQRHIPEYTSGKPLSSQQEMRKSSGNSSGSESPCKSLEICGWCGKSVDDSTALAVNNAIYCSELCFSHSRRASFKKNKTCDWCKHVRHTVSYVDFQDGASQLQFCSDKCLNQYKMQIFCRETRAHLEIHPHLAGEESSSGLITPDLWMRNCRSPHSPSSPIGSGTSVQTTRIDEPQTSPLPLITIAHPSKLLASPTQEKNTMASPNRKRKMRKRSLTHQQRNAIEIAQDLRIRQSPQDSNHAISSASHPPTNGTMNEFPELTSRLFAPSAGAFSFPRYNGLASREDLQQRIQQHQPQIPQPSLQTLSSQVLPPNGIPASLLPFPRPNILPPVTVMVPYPVMIPVPIPIPIPLPLSVFIEAAKVKPVQNCNNSNISVHEHEQHDSGKESFMATSHPENSNQYASSGSEDEEIVVDDIRDVRQKDSKENGGLIEHSESGTLFDDGHENNKESNNIATGCSIVPMQFRKHKTDRESNSKVGNLVYKHKKTLSV